MKRYKKEIIDKLCYTALVYARINKKLKMDFPNDKIEQLMATIILETDEKEFIKTGKNIYITNNERNIRLTIISHPLYEQNHNS